MKALPLPSTGHRTRSRRRVGAVLGVALVIVVLVVGAMALLTRSSGDDDAATVRFLPARPATPGPAASLAWWSPVRGEPLGVAVDGSDVAVTALDEVRLLDAEHGRTRWDVRFAGVRRYRPAIGAETVAATSETELVVLDRSDGRRIATAPFRGPGPAAIVADADGRPMAIAGSETGAMLAVDADSGGVAWSNAYPGSVTVAPRSSDGTVVASWHDPLGATVRALDAASGAVRWEVRLGVVNGAPVVADGSVLLTDGEGIHSSRVRALDVRTGRERWQVPLAGWWDDELEAVVDSTTVYLLDGMGTVVALDPTTGAVRWRRETGRPLVSGRLALTPGSVTFASYDDELLALDRVTGELRAVEPQRGVPVDVAGVGDRLVVALRLGAPSRIEARPEP